MKIAAILPSTDPSQYTTADISTLITNITTLALGLAGAVAVIFIIIGAYGYLTAFGNEEKATKAKTTITWAIIGIVVIVLAEVIVTIVWQFITPEKLQLPT